MVKLETNGRPDDELIGYVDDILDELVTGHGTVSYTHLVCHMSWLHTSERALFPMA